MSKETSQPYILTQDTKAALKTINVSVNIDGKIDAYFNRLTQAVNASFPPRANIEVMPFFEANIDFQLNSKVSQRLVNEPNTVCLCLDRFLLSEIEEQFSDRFLRISVNRTVQGKKTSRQGNPPLDQQFQTAAEFIGNKNTIIVDDGIFSGGTVKYIIDNLKNKGVNPKQISRIIGYVGDKQTTQIDQIPVDIIAGIDNLFEWIDIRDFSILGGKQFEASKSNNVTSAIPYLYPWSDGSGASFNRLGCFFEISQKMIQSFVSLISDFETTTGKYLKFRDLIKAGFPLPTNQEKTIPVNINNKATEYLQSCLEIIKIEQQREVVILDMDGTLYQLDGQNNGYSDSRLEKAVLENCQKFIIGIENCSPEAARLIMKQGLQDSIGLSNFLSQRYGISRENYFDNVWNLNPQNLIFNYQTQVDVVKQLAQTGTKLILLTSAPKVWQQQVINYLDLTDCFESVYTGESFAQKSEIFQMLSERYQPGKINSVGDQESTDIAPAAACGCRTLLVKNPNDFKKLLI